MVKMMVAGVEMMVEDISHLFSFFSLLISLFFSPSSFILLLLFFLKKIHKNDIRICRSFRIFEESM